MASDNSLAGNSAIITGASAGIGRATAYALAAEGADVAIAARRQDRLNEIASDIQREHDVEALAIPTDVTADSQVDHLIEQTVDAFGGLDVAVSNAATGVAADSVEDISTDEYRRVMRVNTDGMFFTARASLPHLRASSGVLIFTGSFAGIYSRPHAPLYAATKFWTRGFALSLSGIVGEDDVAVSVVNPTEVRTEWGRESADSTHEERFAPNEVTEPEEVADAIVFAARQESPNMVSELNLYRRDKFSHF